MQPHPSFCSQSPPSSAPGVGIPHWVLGGEASSPTPSALRTLPRSRPVSAAQPTPRASPWPPSTGGWPSLAFCSACRGLWRQVGGGGFPTQRQAARSPQPGPHSCHTQSSGGFAGRSAVIFPKSRQCPGTQSKGFGGTVFQTSGTPGRGGAFPATVGPRPGSWTSTQNLGLRSASLSLWSLSLLVSWCQGQCGDAGLLGSATRAVTAPLVVAGRPDWGLRES